MKSSSTFCIQNVDFQYLSVILSSLLLAPEVLQVGGMSWLGLKVVMFPSCFCVMAGPVLLDPWVGHSLSVDSCVPTTVRHGSSFH